MTSAMPHLAYVRVTMFLCMITGLNAALVKKGLAARQKTTAFYINSNSHYLQTSGSAKKCSSHTDCYTLREPDEWCPLPLTDKFYEKGCFCDPSRSSCVIQREGATGDEYTDCTPRSQSKCEGHQGQKLSDVPSMAVVSDSHSLAPSSVYVKTTGQLSNCKLHQECYGMREPSEWCPLPTYDKYYEKGCFCDRGQGKCVIERQTPGGSEYTDCASKTTFQCTGKNGQNEQPSAAVQKPEVGSGGLAVSPNGHFVQSTGKPKQCTQHSDCYQMREPSEWCPLPPNDRYYEKGCFCDPSRSRCTIERAIPGGSEYTDCTDVASFQCHQ